MIYIQLNGLTHNIIIISAVNGLDMSHLPKWKAVGKVKFSWPKQNVDKLKI